MKLPKDFVFDYSGKLFHAREDVNGFVIRTTDGGNTNYSRTMVEYFIRNGIWVRKQMRAVYSLPDHFEFKVKGYDTIFYATLLKTPQQKKCVKVTMATGGVATYGYKEFFKLLRKGEYQLVGCNLNVKYKVLKEKADTTETLLKGLNGERLRESVMQHKEGVTVTHAIVMENSQNLGVYRPDVATRKAGKVRVELVDDGFPFALRELAKVMTWAQEVKGYKDHDWLNLPDGETQLAAAASRHRTDHIMMKLQGKADVECVDHESALMHKAHEAFGVLAQLEMMLRKAQ